MVITISRECGSGGHTLAMMVADKLNIPCYDKEIISEVAEKCNVSDEYVREAGELLKGGFLNHIIGTNNYVYPYSTPSLRDKINSVQVDVIKELAKKHDCIIIGRGADYILREEKQVLNVFVKANLEYKIAQAKLKHGLNEKDAKTILEKRDKERSKHYYYYTGRNWSDYKNYDLIIDTGKLGLEEASNIIIEAYNYIKKSA